MNRDTYTAQNATWARPSDRQLETFFRDAENFYAGMRVSAIIYAIGPFDFEADWDFGRWVYEWRRPSMRICVITRSAYVEVIEFTNEHSAGRTAEVLWRRPA